MCVDGEVSLIGGSDGRESACNAGDLGLIPGLGRSPGEGKGYPLQYSGLQNSMDRGDWQSTVHGVAKRWTQLSKFHFLFHFHITKKCSDTSWGVLQFNSILMVSIYQREHQVPQVKGSVPQDCPCFGCQLKFQVVTCVFDWLAINQKLLWLPWLISGSGSWIQETCLLTELWLYYKEY